MFTLPLAAVGRLACAYEAVWLVAGNVLMFAKIPGHDAYAGYGQAHAAARSRYIPRVAA